MLVITFLFSCRKTKNEDDSSDKVKKQEIMFTLYEKHWEARQLIYDIASTQNLSPGDALAYTYSELKKDPYFTNVYFADSMYLHLEKEGLIYTIAINYIDQNGISLNRGSKYEAKNVMSDNYDEILMEAAIEIENKKVLCFVPPVLEFYNTVAEYETQVVKKLEDAKIDLNVVLKTGTECNLDVIKSFASYGMVIMETHGSEDGFMTGLEWKGKKDKLYETKEEWTEDVISTLGQDVYDRLLNGELRFLDGLNVEPYQAEWWIGKDPEIDYILPWHLTITSKGIAAIMPSLNETVIMANMCYSGHGLNNAYDGRIIQPIRPTFLSKNPLSYYCYVVEGEERSLPLNNMFAIACTDTLIKSLFYDEDSTGNAHFFFNNQIANDPSRKTVKSQFRQYGKVNYSFFKCGTLTDPRDSQVYKLACIGNKRWMAENLRYYVAGSLFAHNDPSKLKTYGRLYDYPMASAGQASTQGSAYIQGICPKGWHIPTQLDWENLISELNAADEEELAIMLQSPSSLWLNDPELNNKKRNISGFNALPAGNAYKTSHSAPVGYNNVNANFISSTKDVGIVSPEKTIGFTIKEATSGGQNRYARIGSGLWVYPYATPTGHSYYSCRCVEN